MKSVAQFYAATGRDPWQDDMDRVNCDKAGQIGHWMCGWCDRCDKPRFQCGHLALGKVNRPNSAVW